MNRERVYGFFLLPRRLHCRRFLRTGRLTRARLREFSDGSHVVSCLFVAIPTLTGDTERSNFGTCCSCALVTAASLFVEHPHFNMHTVCGTTTFLPSRKNIVSISFLSGVLKLSYTVLVRQWRAGKEPRFTALLFDTCAPDVGYFVRAYLPSPRRYPRTLHPIALLEFWCDVLTRADLLDSWTLLRLQRRVTRWYVHPRGHALLYRRPRSTEHSLKFGKLLVPLEQVLRQERLTDGRRRCTSMHEKCFSRESTKRAWLSFD